MIEYLLNTPCRCLIESKWDIIALIIFISVFMMGFLTIISRAYKLCIPKSEKEVAKFYVKSLKTQMADRNNHIWLAQLAFIEDKLIK